MRSTRKVFASIEELLEFVTDNPNIAEKKSPYVVTENGKKKYVLSGNSDQAIAAVARQNGVLVETVSLSKILQAG